MQERKGESGQSKDTMELRKYGLSYLVKNGAKMAKLMK